MVFTSLLIYLPAPKKYLTIIDISIILLYMNSNEKTDYNYKNFLEKNSFETLNINLNFGGKESKPLVKIGTHVAKGELIAGGNNVPNIFSPFSATIKDFKKIRTDADNIVSSHIELERNTDGKKLPFIKPNEIKSPLDFLIKIEQQGVIDCQQNCDIYAELHQKIGKIKNLLVNCYDNDEYTKTLKFLFENKIKEIVNLTKNLNKIFSFKSICFIYDFSQEEVVLKYKKLFEKNDILNVLFIPVKNKFDYKIKLKIHFKSFEFSTKNMSKKHTLYFDLKTYFDIFVAIVENRPITYTFITLNGDAIHNTGVLKMPIGVSIREIIEYAKTKNSYEYIDSYVYNALEAQNDKMAFEKEISEETDELKKAELTMLMNKKNDEAQQHIFSKREEILEYYNNCLGLVYEVIGNSAIGVFSQYNVINQATSGVIMLTRNTVKKL